MRAGDYGHQHTMNMNVNTSTAKISVAKSHANDTVWVDLQSVKLRPNEN